jgi:hypothetical protein
MSKKSYKKPILSVVKVDSELSLAMLSDPPGDPTTPSGLGTMPGYVQKGIKFLIR